MKDDAQRAAVSHELAKSRRARDAAERNAGAGDYDTAVNRLYYAALHAAKAVLITESLEPKTNRGVKHLLVLHFVTNGFLPDWAEAAFSRVETERDLADYAATFTVPESRYERCRDECDRLLTAIDQFLTGRGWTPAGG